MKWLIIIMLVASTVRGTPTLIRDGDDAFWKVDTRTKPESLKPGICADAVNCRFEDGRQKQRLASMLGSWGSLMATANLTASANWSFISPNIYYYALSLSIGSRYWYVAGETSLFDSNGNSVPQGLIIPSGTKYSLRRSAGSSPSITGSGAYFYVLDQGNPCGYSRFNSPDDFDVCVLLTDDWRDQSGEDGGKGRAWRIQSGNAPSQIPLNGHDIYGQAMLVPCFKAIVMLREDNERHYFSGSAAGTNYIQLNCAQNWKNGDCVLLWGDSSIDSQFTGSPIPGLNQQYYVAWTGLSLGTNQVALYYDSALTQRVTWTGATGRFYLERQAAYPGPYGNGAPPLIAQGNAAGNTWSEVGFVSVPFNIAVTGNDGSSIWTVPNHRLIPGDEIALSGMATGSPGATPVNGNYYVFPISDHEVQLFDNQTDALLAANGSTTGLETISNFGSSSPVMNKVGASAMPMPSGRIGYYSEINRLVIVNGSDTVLISDPLDPLHYSPMTASLTANVGEADPIVAINSISSSDALIFLKQRSVLAMYNFSQGASNWTLRKVTSEYGCEAKHSVCQWGPNLMFLSRRGYDRVTETAFGWIQPVIKPISYDMKKYTDLIDWNNANLASAIVQNNRLLLALTLKTASPPTSKNNAVLSLNLLNSNAANEDFFWEGKWTDLNVYKFAVHPVYGDEHVTYCDYNSNANWLGEGWVDTTAGGTLAIQTTLTPRAYFNGQVVLALKGEIEWDTQNATATVTAIRGGYNESDVVLSKTYDKTLYNVANAGTYDPNHPTSSTFNAPYREDYTASTSELFSGSPGILQTTVEPLRMRIRGHSIQLQVSNASGVLNVRRIELAAKPVNVTATMT